MIYGIDASRHQGNIDWLRVADSGQGFAFLKATDGIAYRYTDWFHINATLVRAVGLILGAYHFLLDHHPGEAQARFFVNEVQSQFPSFAGVVPIVDIEREADGTTPRIGHLRAFVTEFRRLVPNRPILIYTGRWYWVGVIGNPFGADLGPLWHSEYDGITPIEFDVANGPELDVYGGWTECLVWQHTSSGIVPGVGGNCDRNIFYGDRKALLALAGISVSPPTSTIEEEDDMPYLHASQYTGWSFVDGSGSTWISNIATVNELIGQGVKVISTNADEDDARRIVGDRNAGTDEATFASEKVQEEYLATLAAATEPAPALVEPDPNPG
jgi:GH25 family lysozyme M1 (1,4-beta-N-acetylmuramidase)